jgi:hypothetical protein
MAFMNYVSEEKALLYNFVDGVIIEPILLFGWLYSSRLGRVSLRISCRFGIVLVTDPVAEMVLFHATFVALKARCPLTVNINPDDYKLSGEERLFQG